ncbi:hypothetical protein A3715_14085 [Oleiphilus sp. HI0009]|nr:hypothetical protein A3715_14085 [Oleiphilus sp. HI0009]
MNNNIDDDQHLEEQLSMFDGKIEPAKSSEPVSDLPSIAVEFNVFSHGNAKRRHLDAVDEPISLVSAYESQNKTEVFMRGPAVLGKHHSRLFTEIIETYQVSGVPIYSYLQFTWSGLVKKCGLSRGSNQSKAVKERLLDLATSTIIVSDDKMIDSLIANWDDLKKTASPDMLESLKSRYEAEISHLKKVRAEGKKGFITLRMIDSLAGNDPVLDSKNPDSSRFSTGTVGVRLSPLLALFYQNNKNIFIPKIYEDSTDQYYSSRIISLLKSRSTFYDRWLDTKFAAWFLEPGWQGFKSKQDRSRRIKNIIDSFIEVEMLGVIVDGLRLLKSYRMDRPLVDGDIVDTREKQMYKICNVQRLYPAAESLLVQNGEDRRSILFRLCAIYQSLYTPWGLMEFRDTPIVTKLSEVKDVTTYYTVIPIDQILLRLKKHYNWNQHEFRDRKSEVAYVINLTTKLQQIGILSSFDSNLLEHNESISNVVFHDHIQKMKDTDVDTMPELEMN